MTSATRPANFPRPESGDSTPKPEHRQIRDPHAAVQCERLRARIRTIRERVHELDCEIRKSWGQRRHVLMSEQEKLSDEMQKAYTELDRLDCEPVWPS